MQNLPSNLYSGGAVVLDSQPYVNFYGQMMARKQAKDEALDQYYQNQFKNVNSAGMRTQDIPFFTEKVNGWQQHYQQNKDKIKNPRLDGGKAASEFQSRFQDINGYTQQSKNEAADNKSLLDWVVKNRDLVPENVITDVLPNLEKHLGDPSRKPYDCHTLKINPKPIDVKTEDAYFGGLGKRYKMDDIVTGYETDPKTLTQKVTTTSSFGKEAKEGIANAATERYGYDASFKKHIDDTLANPDNYKRANEIYKKEFGKDIEHPEEGAIAYTLSGIQESHSKQKLEADTFARQKYMEGVRYGHAQDLAVFRDKLKKASDSEQDGMVDELYESVLQDAKKNPILYKPAGGTPFNQYQIKITPAIKKLFAVKNAAGHDIFPDDIRVSEDGKTITPIFYEKFVDDKGKPTTESVKNPKTGDAEVVKEYSQPIMESEFKQRWKKELLGVGGFNKSLKKNKPSTPAIHPLPSGKPKTVKQNGHVYEWNEETGEYN